MKNILKNKNAVTMLAIAGFILFIWLTTRKQGRQPTQDELIDRMTREELVDQIVIQTSRQGAKLDMHAVNAMPDDELRSWLKELMTSNCCI